MHLTGSAVLVIMALVTLALDKWGCASLCIFGAIIASIW